MIIFTYNKTEGCRMVKIKEEWIVRDIIGV
jgi:hypothetical protein